MTRQICGISKLLAHDLCKEFPRLGIIEHHIDDDMATLILDTPVILKAYDDHITLDLGGKLAFISSNDFVSIKIG